MCVGTALFYLAYFGLILREIFMCRLQKFLEYDLRGIEKEFEWRFNHSQAICLHWTDDYNFYKFLNQLLYCPTQMACFSTNSFTQGQCR